MRPLPKQESQRSVRSTGVGDLGWPFCPGQWQLNFGVVSVSFAGCLPMHRLAEVSSPLENTGSMPALAEGIMATTELPKLTELQRRFVENLMDSSSAVAAYKKAGGKATSDKSAWQQASALMRNHEVSAAIAEMKAERAKLILADAAYIRDKLGQIVDRCMQAIPVLDSEGKEVGVWKFDQAGANAALRSLILLEEKFPAPTIKSEGLVAAKERLKMFGIRTELPTEEEWAEIKRLGLRNIGELDDFKKGEAIRAKMRERGIDSDVPPVQPPQGAASTHPMQAAIASGMN